MPRRLLDSPWPYFVGAGVLLLLAIASQFEIRFPTRPEGTVEDLKALSQRDDLNLVLLVVDTLRSDRLSAYGYERPTSQGLDALAGAGILFRNVLSQSSWTKTSMASLWTAALPANHGIVRFNDVLPEEALLPAEILKQAGYRTAGIWRNGWVAPNFGFGQGFDHYVHPAPGREDRRLRGENPGGRQLAGSDEDLITNSLEFLETFGQEKFFLYIHMMDVHQYVYDEAAAIFGTSYSDAYDQAIHWTDRLIGHLMAQMDELGTLDRTIFAVVSDHGEAFREHGQEGHARNLYGEVVRVPWIISLPFRLQQRIVVEERVTNLDVWPTLLDLLGLPPLQAADGQSAMPLVLRAANPGAEPPPARPAIAHLDRQWGDLKKSDPMVTVTDGSYRLHWWADRRRRELYDLVADPGESQNLFDPNDPESQRLEGLARSYMENAQSPWGVEAPEVELDQMRLNQLRALGYIVPGQGGGRR